MLDKFIRLTEKHIDMKKYVVLFVLLSSCATMGMSSEVNINREFPHYEIQRIAVLVFETSLQDKDKIKFGFSKSIVNPNAGTIVADIIARELAIWGKYIVLERRILEKKLKAMNLSDEDILHREDYSSLGKSLGIDAVVIGEIDKYDTSYMGIKSVSMVVLSVKTRVSFLAKCIDVTTNEMVWSIKIRGTSKEDSGNTLASELVAKAVSTLKSEIK